MALRTQTGIGTGGIVTRRGVFRPTVAPVAMTSAFAPVINKEEAGNPMSWPTV
jgi:hypothetical protein